MTNLGRVLLVLGDLLWGMVTVSELEMVKLENENRIHKQSRQDTGIEVFTSFHL